MALNYQRNSYKLWEVVLQTCRDEEAKWIFKHEGCCLASGAPWSWSQANGQISSTIFTPLKKGVFCFLENILQ